ncbi:MAG: lytic transglycosylase domain-containing protein [Thermodesulfobacteriota bacterium]|jgi:soluble lytic murein transglycosylase-like protein
MELNEAVIRTGHPPHSGTHKKNRHPLSRILPKIAIFVLIFLLSFHLPNFIPGLDQREQTIREILEVLESQPTGLANVTKEELAEVIYEEANRYNHDPKFILALIAIESEFKNWSVSEQGAKGLMQIMPYVAKSLAHELGIEWSGDRTLFNPYLNVRIGSYYLFQLIKEFNDPRLALAAYNYGPTYIKSLKERNEKIPTSYFYRIWAVYQDL